MRGDAAGFGHPEAEPTKFTSIAEEKKGSGRRGSGEREVPAGWKAEAPRPSKKIEKLGPGSWAGAEAAGGLETRVDGAGRTEDGGVGQ